MSKTVKSITGILAVTGFLVFSGCATVQQQPLKYVALSLPNGVIITSEKQVEMKHSRGGPYLVNLNFRPAPDISSYIEKAQTAVDSNVLRNTDVLLNVPFAFDILLFGYQIGEDVVKVNK